MTALVKGADLHYLTARLRTCRDAAAVAGADGTAELSWSLNLLRATRVHVSLFRIAFLDHDFTDAIAAMTRAFGRNGMIGRLSDGGIALLLVNTSLDDHETEETVLSSLERAFRDLDLEGAIEVAASHSFASDVGDLDDLLLHLSLLTPMRYRVEHRRSAAVA
ncbi:MAG TPA: hypothetical protein VK943_09125 [Arenibaculum sp.]|nr:hypothetical protein [Arenibaculum sp.]